MNITIRTEPLPPAYGWTPHRPVTGTTKFYVRVAEGLARRSHNVDVVYDGPDLNLNGVRYLPRAGEGRLEADVVFDMNFQGPSEAKRKLQWTSFFGRPDLCNGDGYDRLFLVTEYVQSTMSHYVKCPTTALELGCELPTVATPDLASRPKRCCYTSSPDRGGTMLDSIWPEVQARTGYELVRSPYGADFTEEQLAELYLSSRFWVFPAIGTDSIISALEAQAAGCIPFVVPHMGLPETLRYGVTTDLVRFKERLISTLNDFDRVEVEQMRARDVGLAERPIPTWTDVVSKIEEYL